MTGEGVTAGDIRLRVTAPFGCVSKNSDDTFKPAWKNGAVAFRHKQKIWWAQADGYITTKPIPDSGIPNACYFTVDTDEKDRIRLRSKAFGTYVSVIAPSNEIQHLTLSLLDDAEHFGIS